MSRSQESGRGHSVPVERQDSATGSPLLQRGTHTAAPQSPDSFHLRSQTLSQEPAAPRLPPAPSPICL